MKTLYDLKKEKDLYSFGWLERDYVPKSDLRNLVEDLHKYVDEDEEAGICVAECAAYLDCIERIEYLLNEGE